jgi:hypothetical protein
MSKTWAELTLSEWASGSVVFPIHSTSLTGAEDADCEMVEVRLLTLVGGPIEDTGTYGSGRASYPQTGTVTTSAVVLFPQFLGTLFVAELTLVSARLLSSSTSSRGR